MTAMTEAHELRPAMGVGISFRQQLWLLGVSGRWLYAIGALVPLTVLFWVQGGVSPQFTLIAAVNVSFAAAAWPLIVWFGETPARRQYHWSLPVQRPLHDLARVAAGAAYLVAVCAALAAIAAVGDGTLDWFTAIGPQGWLGFFLTPLILYFLVTPITLWSDYPITRWTLGGFVVFTLVALVLEGLGVGLFTGWIEWVLFGSDWAISLALLDGVMAMSLRRATPGWWQLTTGWLALGLVCTVFTAVYRPDDLKRAFRRAPGVDVAPLQR